MRFSHSQCNLFPSYVSTVVTKKALLCYICYVMYVMYVGICCLLLTRKSVVYFCHTILSLMLGNCSTLIIKIKSYLLFLNISSCNICNKNDNLLVNGKWLTINWKLHSKFVQWSFVINHITNVLPEVVPYYKSGHILLLTH